MFTQFELTLQNVTVAYTLNGVFDLAQSYMLSVETLSKWLVACEWGALIAKVDATLETFNGLTTFLYEVIMNFDSLSANAFAFYPHVQNGNYLEAGISLGTIIGVVFEFKLD